MVDYSKYKVNRLKHASNSLSFACGMPILWLTFLGALDLYDQNVNNSVWLIYLSYNIPILLIAIIITKRLKSSKVAYFFLFPMNLFSSVYGWIALIYMFIFLKETWFIIKNRITKSEIEEIVEKEILEYLEFNDYNTYSIFKKEQKLKLEWHAPDYDATGEQLYSYKIENNEVYVKTIEKVEGEYGIKDRNVYLIKNNEVLENEIRERDKNDRFFLPLFNENIEEYLNELKDEINWQKVEDKKIKDFILLNNT